MIDLFEDKAGSRIGAKKSLRVPALFSERPIASKPFGVYNQLRSQSGFMNTISIHGKEALDKLAKGADNISKSVVSTLGPTSSMVAIDIEPSVWIIHDGINIAKNIKLKDPFENMGAKILRESSEKTAGLAGDGTTTAMLLGNTLFQAGRLLVEEDLENGRLTASNAMELKINLEKTSKIIIDEIKKKARKVKTKEERLSITTISAGSAELGKLIADAMEKVGKDGHVVVEEGDSFETIAEHQRGFEFENGWLSPHLVTDANRMIAEYKDALLLLTDQKISNPQVIKDLIADCIKEDKPLIIVAEDVVGPAMQLLNLLKNRTGAKVIAVMAPEYADLRKQMLEDMAIVFGAKVISGELNMQISDVKIKDLGRVKSFWADEKTTVMTPENPDMEEIEDRTSVIRDQIEKEGDPHRKQRLENRLAKLSQSIVVIKVGGTSKPEVDDRIERLKDAVYALKAAMEDGMVAGGGVTLYEIAEAIHTKAIDIPLENEERQMVINTLKAPFETIITNAGLNLSDVLGSLANRVKKEKTGDNFGFDVVNKKYGDMFEMGVVDPAKVTMLAIKHSFNVAGIMLTTKSLIAAEPDESVQKIKIVGQ